MRIAVEGCVRNPLPVSSQRSIDWFSRAMALFTLFMHQSSNHATSISGPALTY